MSIVTSKRHLLIDLDHTLWDTDANCLDAWRQLYVKHDMQRSFPSVEEVWSAYLRFNEELWAQLPSGRLTLSQVHIGRFEKTLALGGIVDQLLAEQMNAELLSITRRGTRLMPHAVQTLERIKTLGLTISVATNGVAEMQHAKISSAGLDKYFDHFFISEELGVMKPNSGFFNKILSTLDARASECVMVGDNPFADIVGAQSVGIDTVFYNSRHVVANVDTIEISDLSQLEAALWRLESR